MRQWSVWFGIVMVAAAACSGVRVWGQAAPEKGWGVKVAVICRDGGGVKGDEVEGVLTAALSGSKEFGLVERGAVRKVLDEQKLQALSDTAGAVKIGQLTGADLLVFCEGIKDSKPPALRMRAVETVSGVVLMDVLVEVGALTGKPEVLVKEVEGAVRKVGVPVAERKVVGVIGVSSEELNASLDSLAASLGVLLRVDLARSPNVVVLEREQLQHLTAEKGLSGMEVKLRGSTRLVEVKLKKSQEAGKKDEIEATVRITEMAGGKTQTVKLELPGKDIAALRKQLNTEVLKAIDAPLLGEAGTDVSAEAAVFRQRALMLAAARLCQGGDWARRGCLGSGSDASLLSGGRDLLRSVLVYGPSIGARFP